MVDMFETLIEDTKKPRVVDMRHTEAIMDQIIAIVQDNPDYFWEDLEDTFGILSDLGAMCTVYDIGRFVLKVWESDTMYEEFLEFVGSKESVKYQQHLPKIYQNFEFNGYRFVIMKKYYDQPKSHAVCLCDMSGWGDELNITEATLEMIRNTTKNDLLFREIVMKLFMKQDIYNWDLHDANIMVDEKGNKIIIDPWN